MRAQRPIFLQGEKAPSIYILCVGWAVRFLRLRGGERQVISFVMPGEVLSDDAVFGQAYSLSADAITDAQVSRLDASALKNVMVDRPQLFDKFCEAHLRQESRVHELLANIGRRSAKERIAYMLLELTDRLHERSVIQNDRYYFPVRQRDIADLVGITPVHVSRIMTELQNEQTIEMSSSYLRVLNRPALEAIGTLSLG